MNNKISFFNSLKNQKDFVSFLTNKQGVRFFLKSMIEFVNKREVIVLLMWEMFELMFPCAEVFEEDAELSELYNKARNKVKFYNHRFLGLTARKSAVA